MQINFENEIIASLIVDKDTLHYTNILTKEDFKDVKTKKIFVAIKDLYNKDKDVNIITIMQEMKIKEENEKNFLDFVNKITDTLVTSANIDLLVNKITKERQKEELRKIVKDINLDNKDIEDVKNEIITNIKKIKDERQTKIGNNIQDVLIETLEDLENTQDYSLLTGFFDLDKLTDGLHKSELTCIGARPGTGKTAFALNIATQISKKKNVYFVSLEMSNSQLMQRIISRYTQINTQFLRNAYLKKEERDKIALETNNILKLKLKIDTKVRYIEDLEYNLRKLKEQDILDLVVIDYLTLLKSKEKYNSRELEVAEISRKLKLIALDLEIPIIVLVQLNRDAENKYPTMANIRESGTIEQNCDNIIFLYEDKQENTIISRIDIILAKQRNGCCGTIQLDFKKQYCDFQNIIWKGGK